MIPSAGRCFYLHGFVLTQKPQYVVAYTNTDPLYIVGLYNGGDGGIRTHDLRVANAALSQLSYTPIYPAVF